MRITINTDKSNKIFTAPIEKILDDIAYVMYDLSKVNFISLTKDRVSQYFKDCQMDEFITVIECITLNQSCVAYTINMNEDEIEELEKDCNFTDVFKVTYNDAYQSICEVISKYTKNGFMGRATDFETALDYFIHESTNMMQSLQLIDVYKYYKELDYPEDEFIAMLPDEIKPIVIKAISYMKDEHDKFDINNPSDMEQLIDDLCVCNEGFINILRDSAVRHEIEDEAPTIALE